MKTKLVYFAVLMMAMFFAHDVYAQTLTAVCPSGQTLTYTVNSWDTTTLTLKHTTDNENIELNIPDTVRCEGRTYTVTRSEVGTGQSIYYCRDNHGFKNVSIPNTMKCIGNNTFFCSGIKTISIPESVDTIGPGAFWSCMELLDITIPNTVKYIGGRAFNLCPLLGTVEIPNSVQTIVGIGSNGEPTFGQLGSATNGYITSSKVKNIYYTGSIAGAPWGALHLSTYKEDGLYYADSTKTVLNGCDHNYDGVVYIPSTVNIINSYAFFNCDKIIGVDIPNSVRTIRDSAFYGCTSLNYIYVPDSVDSIGSNAFYQITNINHSYASGAPWGAYYMNSVWDFFEGLLYSGASKAVVRGFYTPYGSRIIFPESVTSILPRAFKNSDKINWIIFNAVNCAAPLRLSNPETIQELEFGNSVQSIPDSCFINCSRVQALTFPASLTTIGDYAFAGCDSLISITMLATTPPTISANTFAGVPTDVEVVVPCGSLQAYLADANWRYFTNIHTVGCPGIINAVASDSSMGTVTGGGSYNGGDTAVVVATSGVGHHFVAWSNGETVDTLRIVVNGDSTLTAYFAADTFTVAVTVNDTVMGTVAGGGPYLYGNSATLTATANPRHFFARWGDNSTDNPRTVTVTQDTLFTAYFAQTIVDTVIEHDTTYIDVFVRDTTYIDVHDTTYIDVHDTTYVDVFVHDTTYIDVFVHDTTYIDVHDTTYIDVHDTTFVDVFVHDTTYVDVMVHDTTIVIDTLWLTQIDTLWLHDTIVIHDTVYITHEGIDGVETLNVKVYASNGQIVVDGAEGQTVTLYDVMGRKMTYSSPLTSFGSPSPNLGEELRIDVPVSGTYLIKIGDWPARKVVVLK